MRDVIVIGAGLAGLMGALALADAGRRPYVLAKGQGATHWTAGTIDVWGAPGAASLHDALGQLISERPDHPYGRAGLAAVEGALARFRALMDAARYPYVGSMERNVMLPTAIGALRPAALMPATMAAGDARLGGDVLIAGFRELRDFFPPVAADNLRAQGVAARGVYLELPPGTARTLDFSTRNFADLFDDAGFRQDVGRQLRALRGSATRIGLPAVLGLKAPLVVVEELQRLAGAPVFEIPTLPPSVPGMRLFRIFEQAIVQAGGRLQIGAWVHGASGRGTHLDAVSSEAAARRQEYRAHGFLLATGGMAGGGLRSDHTGALRETALGLPVEAPAARGEWFSQHWLAPQGHPIYRAGVAVDGMLRPLDGERVMYDNVAVAGAALAGADLIRERCYTGVALATGWQAARLLSERLPAPGTGAMGNP
jgi:glycerol-3-phosphate dehydrogenase subunit B